MIAIITEAGTLRIAGELPIPNDQSWGAERISRLMAQIEQFVFAAELADKVPRKHNTKSGLVIDDHGAVT
jgi:D-mannonate dehydratase